MANSWPPYSAGAKIFNSVSVEDLVFKNGKVNGLVINWTCVERLGLHVDPLTVIAENVVDGTGHPSEILNLAVKKAKIQLDTPTGDIIGDVNKRRGRVLGMNPVEGEDGYSEVEAEVPMSEMHDFTTSLRSSTQGRGSFTFVFDHYEELRDEGLKQAVIEEVSSKSFDSLEVVWKKVEGASGYELYRSDSKNGKFSCIATIEGGDKTSYVDKKRECGKTYFYYIRSLDFYAIYLLIRSVQNEEIMENTNNNEILITDEELNKPPN